MISKDQSIITQVAAKIAAELTHKTDDVNVNISNWVIAFDAVLDGLNAAHGGQPAEPVGMVTQAFPGTVVEPSPAPTPQSAPAGGVQIKGTQHGPIPDWLHHQAATAGVSSVWDNRDGLQANPKRPWFKAADGTKNDRGQDVAFWPPR